MTIEKEFKAVFFEIWVVYLWSLGASFFAVGYICQYFKVILNEIMYLMSVMMLGAITHTILALLLSCIFVKFKIDRRKIY